MSGNNGQKIGQDDLDQVSKDVPRDTRDAPVHMPSTPSFWKRRSTKVGLVSGAIIAAAGYEISKRVAPEIPVHEIRSLSLFFGVMSAVLLDMVGRDNPLESLRASFGKAAVACVVAVGLQVAGNGLRQLEANEINALPQINVKPACAAAGVGPGRSVRTENGYTLVCP